jgi:O-methyltransferase domain/Dimerisation domain
MSQTTLIQEKPKVTTAPDPSKIMNIGMGYWASKTMLVAVKFRLFTHLAAGALSGKQIKEKLGLRTTDRHVYDWLDALVSLGFLQREGTWDEGKYSNTKETDLFLDKNKPSYIGGILEMANNRLYRFWGDLEEGLLTGLPQNEGKNSEQKNMGFFSELYKDPVKLQEFMDAMSGIQMGNFMALVTKFDFSKYNSLLDVGGADGWLSIQVCLRHPGIECTTFDLPPVEPLAKNKIAQFNLSDRIKVAGGDFLKDKFPEGEIIVMGNILHGMNEETKQEVMNKIYDSLPEGGVFIAIENIIDNERKENTFGLLMSLNMLIENGDAFDYTFNDFERWAEKAGFERTELLPLAGPTSAAIAYK